MVVCDWRFEMQNQLELDKKLRRFTASSNKTLWQTKTDMGKSVSFNADISTVPSL